VSRNLADLAGVPTEPIPLSVLTGFLGSDKTTFLSTVLAVPDLRDTAVIVSEFGAIALDHLLLEAAVDDVLELPNGCTCCAVRQGLADSFYRLLRSRQAIADRPPFRRIAQSAVADLLLITKTDLSPALDELIERLASVNTTAPIAGDADANAILFGGLTQSATAAAAERGGSPCAWHLFPFGLAAAADDPAGLCDGSGRAGARPRREATACQGLVKFADRPGGPAAIHAVQRTLYPPRWLERWPDADSGSRLVFVVRDLEPDKVFRRFAAGEPACITPPVGAL
jgi:G3E family GTPase